jgi:pyruvate kinase
MQTNPKPTRAEVSDVANAIFDSADAVMLSGETAIGLYPVEAVKMQSVISRRMEEILDYRKLAEESHLKTNSTNDAIASSVANAALLLSAKLIVAFSMTGGTSRRMSYYRPSCPIISVTGSKSVIRKLCLNWGVYAYHNPVHMHTMQDFEQKALEIAAHYRLQPQDRIILTGGDGEGNTNFMKIISVK